MRRDDHHAKLTDITRRVQALLAHDPAPGPEPDQVGDIVPPPPMKDGTQ